LLVKKVKAEGLAHLSYLVGGTRQAAVIDPRRDCQTYLDIADRAGLRITNILETHRNEDYVTGSRELESLTGAEVLHGDLDFDYGKRIEEGEEVDLGETVLRALATPGHTPESMSYVLYDRSAGPQAVGVFTGDALFVGEVGRTDLLGKEVKRDLASQLYDSLHIKLIPLGPGTIIYPAHGAGSACGGSISNREESTIGLEMEQNKALRIRSKEEFVEMKMNELMEKPFYFEKMEDLNLHGQPVLGRLPHPEGMLAKEFQERAERGATVLDVRSPTSFAGGHVPGSISIPKEVLPNYAGWVLEYGRDILLVTDGPDDVEDIVRILVRIGYDTVAGHLVESVEGWAKAGYKVQGFPLVTPRELYHSLSEGENLTVMDVRTRREWVEERVDGSMYIFAGYLKGNVDEVPRDRPVAVLCSSGLRGSLGASILQNQGYEVLNVLGGTGAWKRSGLPMVK
jgi:hydroxyacylglutathione hydrolase